MNIDVILLRINTYIVNPFLALLFVLATLYFVYGLVRYLLAGQSDEDRTTGKSHMMWGLLGMFLMISVFGIMRLIVNTFGIDLGEFGTEVPAN